jgi:hypothetical protein
MPSTIQYSTSLIQEKVNKTTHSFISVYVTQIVKEFESFLASSDAVAKSEWTYEFECNPTFMEALNIELKKHFDSSVFVRVYGGMARSSSNKLVCLINWGRDQSIGKSIHCA